MNLSLVQKHSTFLQDNAAGGLERRKIKIKSGDVATVSIAIKNDSSPFHSQLRFKSGITVQRALWKIDAKDKNEALKIAWQKLREGTFIQDQGWVWMI